MSKVITVRLSDELLAELDKRTDNRTRMVAEALKKYLESDGMVEAQELALAVDEVPKMASRALENELGGKIVQSEDIGTSEGKGKRLKDGVVKRVGGEAVASGVPAPDPVSDRDTRWDAIPMPVNHDPNHQLCPNGADKVWCIDCKKNYLK